MWWFASLKLVFLSSVCKLRVCGKDPMYSLSVLYVIISLLKSKHLQLYSAHETVPSLVIRSFCLEKMHSKWEWLSRVPGNEPESSVGKHLRPTAEVVNAVQLQVNFNCMKRDAEVIFNTNCWYFCGSWCIYSCLVRVICWWWSIGFEDFLVWLKCHRFVFWKILPPNDQPLCTLLSFTENRYHRFM